MVEEIGFENGRISNFQGLVTLTLTLDPATRHTIVHHSSISTYISNFIEIEETFCGRTDGRTYGRTFPPSNIIRSTFGSRPKNCTISGHSLDLGGVLSVSGIKAADLQRLAAAHRTFQLESTVHHSPFHLELVIRCSSWFVQCSDGARLGVCGSDSS